MDRLLTCPNCLNIYNKPRKLECEHILCTKCIEKIYNPGVTPIIKCPICNIHSMVITSINNTFPVVQCVEELVYYRSQDKRKDDDLISTTPLSASLNKTTTTTTTTTSTSSLSQRNLLTSPILISTSPKLSPTSPSLQSKQSNIQLSPQRASTISNNVLKPPLKLKAISSPPIAPVVCKPEKCNTLLNDKNRPVLISSDIVQTPRINDSTVQQLSKCPEHTKNFSNFCLECDVPVCIDCTTNNHSNHTFSCILSEAEKRIGDIESTIITMSLSPNRLLNKKNKIEKIINESSLVLQETKQKISNDIDLMIENLKERKQTLINQIEKEHQDQKVELSEQITTIHSTINEIQNNNTIAQGIVSLYLSQVENEAICSSLLKKHNDLKKLEQLSDNLANNIEVNAEYKWDPDFHFPQLFARSNGEKTTVVYRTKRTSKSNGSPKANSPLMSQSMSSIPNDSSSSTPTMVKPSINQSSPGVQSTTQIMINNSNNQNNTPSSPNGPAKIQLKNPVFGKILTRKESISTGCRQFIYGFSDEQVEIYDNITKIWRPGSKILKKTTEYSTIFDNNSTVYRFGGKECPQDIYKYSIDKDWWELSSIKIPSKRNGHCCLFDGNKLIYLIGGAETDSSKLLEVYNIENQTWKRLASMKNGRSYFNAFYHPSKKCIYVIDGYVNKDKKSSVEMYSIEKNQWNVVCDIDQPRYFSGVSFDGSRYINIIGGIDRRSSRDLKNMERFDTKTNKWEVLQNETHRSALSHTSSTMNLVVQSPQMLKKTNSFSSISSQSSQSSSHSSPLLNTENEVTNPTEKIQFFNSTFFDGEQHIYFYGINIEENSPLLYKFSIKTKKFEKIIIENTKLDLFSQLIFVSK
ncbi:hypothetical protein DICPUDRAFT_93469 [Dictyostelium purpureum]|uniref:RING-type domain-containing protein n=1 Tax=Dictyostelium purpureum TaxID=5786 RepID=F0Z7U5_DICPU|nr:uncharacterized protein DICPUDRAFT_93469 [Dictyostelium purpureum]EGC39971.1 hypothetical protein DICPUDRAFT_93469 [Dictyostelium purpureum]|eukprot:XP_003283474.1 hypothetical protein DICPUDRAFT_93469 [Dictyostelium purpureum]